MPCSSRQAWPLSFAIRFNISRTLSGYLHEKARGTDKTQMQRAIKLMKLMKLTKLKRVMKLLKVMKLMKLIKLMRLMKIMTVMSCMNLKRLMKQTNKMHTRYTYTHHCTSSVQNNAQNIVQLLYGILCSYQYQDSYKLVALWSAGCLAVFCTVFYTKSV